MGEAVQEAIDADMEQLQNELANKTQTAIQRIREHEPPEGYYLAFSGGKDSTVIYSLAQKAGVKFDAHFNRTSIDPKEVLDFIKENYPDIIQERWKKSMFQLILSNSSLPTRTHRFCCRYLKERGGINRVVMTGVRWEESSNRANRPIFLRSYKNKNTWFLNPIVDWTYDDVWDYLAINKIPHCSLYNEGRTRIGCILCPFLSVQDKLRDIERYPKYWKAYQITCRKLYEILKERKRLPKTWTSPERMLEWWIYGKVQDHSTQQEQLS